jgi:hypothetical protein
MARYYFDIDDSEQTIRDTNGLDCIDRDAVQQAAIRALHEVALDMPVDCRRRDVTVLVRNASGHAAFRATLSLSAQWLDGAPA